MKINLFLIVFLFLIVPYSVGAIQLEDEMFNYGGSNYDYFEGITSTNDGGYVVVGGSGSTDIEGIENKGWMDAIIVKYDKDGNVVWQRSYGGNRYDYFYGITSTNDGGYVVVGYSSSIDIEGIENKGYEDAIIVKYDKDGNMIWQRSYGGSDNDNFLFVTSTTDGGYVSVGYSDYDAIIVKYDKDGNVVWQRSYGESNNDSFLGITLATDGGYVSVGYSGDDAVIIKYDKDGNMVWQRSYSGNSNDYFYGITLTTDGDYIVVGSSNSTDIEGIENKGGFDDIIIKYDKDGNMIWQRSYGGSNNDSLLSVTLTSDDDYIVVGHSRSDIEGIENKGEYDAVIIKYDKDGNMVLKKSYGGNRYDYFWGITLTTDGDYIGVGSSNSTDIEKIENKGENDAIITKLSFSYDIVEEEVTNGKFSVIQEDNKGKVEITPFSGYELDSIVITNSNGEEVPYYEEDGYYYFDLNDDVSVSVFYKEIVNPKTGVYNPFILLILVLFTSIIIYLTRKKKYL